MRAPHIGGINGDVQCGLATLTLKNGEKLEDFHRTIIRLKQEMILSEETVSPTRLIFQYMKEFSNRDKLKALIVTNITDLTTFLDNNRKLEV